jgi:T5SS/PEP-CTERM-associated repeat protein
MKRTSATFSTFAIAGVTGMLGLSAAADEIHWYIIWEDSRFSDPISWEESVVPGAEDVAIFDGVAQYTVLFDDSEFTDRVLVRAGFVTFELGYEEPSTYELLNSTSPTPGIVVGEGGGDVADLSIHGGTLVGAYAAVGHQGASFGTLTVDGPQTTIELEHDLRIGQFGNAMLNLIGGATALNGPATIALGGGTFALADVVGPDTTWQCDGNLTVGKGGVGELLIDDGAAVSCLEAIIAQNRSTHGTVTVRGEGSSWTIQGSLDVAQAGFAELNIEDGASVSNGEFAVLGAFPDMFEESQGQANVLGEGSTWTIDGDLWIGFAGLGLLHVADSARLIVENDLLLYGSFETYTIGFTLHESDADAVAPLIAVGGFVTPVGRDDVRINLADGFEPGPGQSFLLMTALAGIDELVLDLEPLPGLLDWSVLQTADRLELTVISRADLTGDGVVDVFDLLELLGDWGPCAECPADLNDDGVVDVFDLLALLGAWG